MTSKTLVPCCYPILVKLSRDHQFVTACSCAWWIHFALRTLKMSVEVHNPLTESDEKKRATYLQDSILLAQKMVVLLSLFLVPAVQDF